ncbi:hypothetical protein E8E12_006135 [Didymella heteroderae]|uniref:Uncharacterized protein n=1 Tax=Didymella heteroderae TaxID=1769908 RepID=A0A9P4WV18_9PLEO|nr:hypothetical protein E8E12_006135 [Didymella heteroderae]
MCLKYFVSYSACDHHEYLGSHHCSLRPCNLDTQHFHYIEDDFPIPWPEDLEAEQGVLACQTCASKQRNKLDPDEAPVQSYAPTNHFQVREIRSKGCNLPVDVVKVEDGDGTTESTLESEDSNDSFDYDYKSLSDADDEEWNMPRTGYGQTHDEELAQKHREHFQNQPRSLPSYLMQQPQNLPFAPPGLTPEAYAAGSYLHHQMPHMGRIAAPSVPSIGLWHGGMTSLSCAPTKPIPTHPDDSPSQLLPEFIPKNADKHTTPASLPQRPATPPPTPRMHPLPPRPTPPFIVGNITDAYLRMQVAKRRHIRERARRQRSSLQDALPARRMALTDFMIKKKIKRGHHKEISALEDMGVNAWSRLPFAGEGSDTG